MRGEAVLLLPDGAAEAERSFRHAIEVAQKSGALSWELRAAVSLARMLAGVGKRDEARATVNSSLAKFSEGFDTFDLVQAKSLLAELGS
jgi:predicted ATPase